MKTGTFRRKYHALGNSKCATNLKISVDGLKDKAERLSQKLIDRLSMGRKRKKTRILDHHTRESNGPIIRVSKEKKRMQRRRYHPRYI